MHGFVSTKSVCWEVHCLGGGSRIWWAETRSGDQGLEWGLQEAPRLATGIPGHMLTPDPLDPSLTVKPVAGPFCFLKEGAPLPGEKRGPGCPGWNVHISSAFSVLSLAFPLCLSQPVPQKVLWLLLVHTPCSNCFARPPLENAQSSGVRCQPDVGMTS